MIQQLKVCTVLHRIKVQFPASCPLLHRTPNSRMMSSSLCRHLYTHGHAFTQIHRLHRNNKNLTKE